MSKHTQFRLRCTYILIIDTLNSTELKEKRKSSVSVTEGRGRVNNVKFRSRAMQAGG